MRKFLWSFFEVFETVTVAVVAVFLIRTFVAQPFLVSGSSMEPTFQDGNYLLIDELAYRFREPERGEVVVFRYPSDHRSFFIKRIIGLPGEHIVIEQGTVNIYLPSGETKVLRESYANPLGGTFGRFEATLGPDQYFVMGDNRNFSFDSRNWGPLSRADIIGLTRFRLWPAQTATVFSTPLY